MRAGGAAGAGVCVCATGGAGAGGGGAGSLVGADGLITVPLAPASTLGASGRSLASGGRTRDAKVNGLGGGPAGSACAGAGCGGSAFDWLLTSVRAAVLAGAGCCVVVVVGCTGGTGTAFLVE